MTRILAFILAAAIWPVQRPDPPAFAIPGYFKGGFKQMQKLAGGDETIEVTASDLVWTRMSNAAMKDFGAGPRVYCTVATARVRSTCLSTDGREHHRQNQRPHIRQRGHLHG